jgi:hypothetical protein
VQKPEKQELVGLHIRIPKTLLGKLLVRRDALRKRDPVANLSDVVRTMLENSVREKR